MKPLEVKRVVEEVVKRNIEYLHIRRTKEELITKEVTVSPMGGITVALFFSNNGYTRTYDDLVTVRNDIKNRVTDYRKSRLYVSGEQTSECLIGIVYCSDNETYNYAAGRKKAFNKLVTHLIELTGVMKPEQEFEFYDDVIEFLAKKYIVKQKPSDYHFFDASIISTMGITTTRAYNEVMEYRRSHRLPSNTVYSKEVVDYYGGGLTKFSEKLLSELVKDKRIKILDQKLLGH